MKNTNLLLLIILIITFSCGDNENVIQDKVYSDRTQEVTSLSKEIEDAAIDNKVLSSYNDNEKSRVLALIKNTADLIVALESFSNQTQLINKIFENINEYEQLFLVGEDDSLLNDFFKKAYDVAFEYAQINGLAINSLYWKQFTYDFSQGISPFGLYSEGGVDWSADFQQGKPLALVKGTGFSSWLISPEFDLSNISKASFSFSQLIGLDKNNRESSVDFNRQKFLAENFIVKISADFDGVDPSLATWDKVKISNMPSSLDFNKVKSEDINLARYIGKKITIAFHYDAESSKVGRHYLNWNIYDLSLKTDSILPKITKRPEALLVEKFSGTLNDFNSLKIDHDSSSWGYSKAGSNEFAVINSNSSDSSTWLISNKYKIGNVKNGSLVIKQVAKNLNLKKASMKISTDYFGGDPRNSKWVEVKHSFDGNFVEDKWTNLSSELIDLSDYVGKEIVVAFEFIQEVGDSSTWEIVSLNFSGQGQKILKSKLNYTYKDPVNPDFGKVVLNINLANIFTDLETQNVSGNGALYTLNTRGNSSVRISGFKEKNIGVSRLIVKGIDISNISSPSLMVNHSVNFAKDIAAHKLTRVYVRDSNTLSETLVELDNYPAGNSFDAFSSGPYFIPAQLNIKSMDIIFEYESLDNNFVTWDLFDIKVMEN